MFRYNGMSACRIDEFHNGDYRVIVRHVALVEKPSQWVITVNEFHHGLPGEVIEFDCDSRDNARLYAFGLMVKRLQERQ